MNKLVAYFFRILAIVSSVPIPIFTVQFMWHGMDGRVGWEWWVYAWAFLMTSFASVLIAYGIAWGIWPHWYVANPRKKLSESRDLQPYVIEPEVVRELTPEQALNLMLVEQNRRLASILKGQA